MAYSTDDILQAARKILESNDEITKKALIGTIMVFSESVECLQRNERLDFQLEERESLVFRGTV